MTVDPYLVIGLANLLAAGLVAALAIPMVRGRVGRNHLYGVRNRHSLASDRAWRRINAHGGRLLLIWSVPVALAGVLALTGWLAPRPVVLIAFALAPVLYLVPCLLVGRRSAALAAAEDPPEEGSR